MANQIIAFERSFIKAT